MEKGYKGVVKETPLYFAIVKYIAGCEDKESKISVTIEENEEVSKIQLATPQGIGFIYHSRMAGTDADNKPIVQEVRVITGPGNGRPHSETIISKGVAGRLELSEIQSYYRQIDKKCVNMLGGTEQQVSEL